MILNEKEQWEWIECGSGTVGRYRRDRRGLWSAWRIGQGGGVAADRRRISDDPCAGGAPCRGTPERGRAGGIVPDWRGGVFRGALCDGAGSPALAGGGDTAR